MINQLTLLAHLVLACSVSAIVTPTSPDSNTVVKVGDPINALWTADPTGTWNDVTIQLMTGDNYQMVPLQTLTSGVDGTTATSFSAPAPDVSPNAKIYFLQFSNGGNMTDLTWTTRFTIAGPDGSTTQPTNTTDFNGVTVQWGTGALLDSDSTTASSNATAATPTASASSSSPAASSSSTSASASGLTLYTDGMSSAPAMTSASAAAAGSASASASVAPSSGAGKVGLSLGVRFGMAGLVGLVGLLV